MLDKLDHFLDCKDLKLLFLSPKTVEDLLQIFYD